MNQNAIASQDAANAQFRTKTENASLAVHAVSHMTSWCISSKHSSFGSTNTSLILAALPFDLLGRFRLSMAAFVAMNAIENVNLDADIQHHASLLPGDVQAHLLVVFWSVLQLAITMPSARQQSRRSVVVGIAIQLRNIYIEKSRKQRV